VDEDGVLVDPGGGGVAIDADSDGSVTLEYVLRDVGDTVDLGDLNAPATVVIGERNTSTGFDAELEPHESLRFPPDTKVGPDWTAIGLIVGLLSLGAWLIVLWARPRAAVAAEDVDDLPSAHAPAVVGWLLRHGRVTVEDLAATVVDLTARGYILPFRREGVLVLGQGRPANDVVPHERLVLDWLFADWVRQADLGEQRAAIAADPDRWSDLWTGFVEAVEAEGAAEELIERDVASPAVLTAASAGLALLFAGVVGTANGHPGWIAPLVVGAMVLPSATAFARRTPAGEALAARWEAFGARLRSGQGLTPHALAYAVTLGEDAVVVDQPAGGPMPVQLVHDEVERHVTGWREAYLTATSVRGEPSERVRALLTLRGLRRRIPNVLAELES
jgi:hypothetical protein